uniref:SEA domain-containing protein n=1 Tax=Cacopsylla melanoneura TaxID=428564 RepID=A0A8D8VGA9_9HEMI
MFTHCLVTLLYLGSCVHFSSSQQGQPEFFFSNAAAQRGQFQPLPSAQSQQFSNFFQPINSGPFSPFRSQDISPSSQPQFQTFQQTFPSQPTAFQVPPIQSSVPTNTNFNNFITSSRASPPAQNTFQPIKPQPSFQPSSNFRQQKQQQPFSSVPTATRSDPRFQFTSFSTGEAQPQPSRPSFQSSVPVSTFQSPQPQAFSEVFQDDTPSKQQFNSFVNEQLQKDNIDDFIPQNRWRNTRPNAEIDTNRLQRKPQPTTRAPSPPPRSRIPTFSSDDDTDGNDSNSLGQQSSDYDEPTFFKQTQTGINKQNTFQRTKPLNDRRTENLSPKTRFEISTYRPQHQFIPKKEEPIEIENEEEEELEDGEGEEEYIDEPVKPAEPVRTTQAVRTDSRYRPTTYSPPSGAKARFINNQNNKINRQNVLDAQPEVTTFRQKPLKNISFNKESTRNNSTIIPVTLKKQFKITGPIGAVKNNSTFDVVVMNKDHTFVTDENFKGFVDSASIDVTDTPHIAAGEPNASDEESGGLQVAVEPSTTTKRTTVETTTTPSPTTVRVTKAPSRTSSPTSSNPKQSTPTSVSPPNNGENPSSTESWVIVASVQTSRSVSGARFIPSGAVKQEEQPKPLVPKSKENEDEIEKTTSSRNSSSTESIIDKLDRVQSELSSGILGGFNPSKPEDKFDLDPPEKITTEAVTTKSNTTPSSSEESSSPKFVPSSKRFTTTSKPSTSKPSGKTSLKDSIQFDEELVGLLPQGFKPRTYTNKKSTTTTTTSIRPTSEESEVTSAKPSSTTRSLLPKLKPKIKFEEVKSLVPEGYTPPSEESEKAKPALESILSKVKFDDVSALLPPGFKSESSPPERSGKFVPKIKFDESASSSLLPKGFKPQGPAPIKNVTGIIGKAKPVDISAFLPPGFKPTEEPELAEDTVKKTSVNTVNESPTESSTAPEENGSTTSSSKVVFPSRPGAAAATRKNSTASGNKPGKGGAFIGQPKIQKGWPTRATTEFAGWPSPPTSTISIEEILRAAKAAATSTESSEAAAAASSTTTTTTTTTPAPTTPGYCTTDCELAATIKLVGGAKWVPELYDHNTKEWKTLANEVEEQLDAVYSGSASLNRWYKKIRIDAFSPGSVLVDYFVELSELGRTVSTADMKRLFHESLLQSTVNSEALTAQASAQQADYSKLKLGTFDVDPKFTDFVVLQKPQVPVVGMAEQDTLLPQWAIAVIVIGLASLLFVLIFGITVLVSRHKNAKKQPSPLTEDMLHELNKNHMGGHENYGADDLYNMEDVWNDKPIKKRGSTAYHDNSMPNLYDSWRSDWNGYYYNAYYGAGGGGGGAGSNHRGYATRRRSDYDTNF